MTKCHNYITIAKTGNLVARLISMGSTLALLVCVCILYICVFLCIFLYFILCGSVKHYNVSLTVLPLMLAYM